MRVTDRMLSQNYLTYLSKNKNNLEEIRNKIATNQNVSKPSDSPVGIAKILKLQYARNLNSTFTGNIENSQAYLETTINTMEQMLTEVDKVGVKLAELNNATVKDFKPMYADQIKNSLSALLEMSASEFDGKYVFGGTDNSGKPYGYTSDKSAIEQKVPDTSGVQNVRIRKNTVIKVNVSGDELFGTIDGTDIFNTLNDIVTKLNNGERPDDATMDIVKDFGAHMRNSLSEVGNRLNRLEDTKNQIASQNLVIENLISQENEVDMGKAVMELQSREYILNVSYQLASKINQRSLMDYL